MDYDGFDARQRPRLRLARPQDPTGANAERMDLHDAGVWLWRYAQLMAGLSSLGWPQVDVDATTRAELRQLVTLALQVMRALQRRQARRPAPSREG